MVQKASLFQQFYILCYKQFLLLIRNKVITFVRLTTPLWALVIYYAVYKSLTVKTNVVYSPEPFVFNYESGSHFYLQYNFNEGFNPNAKEVILNTIMDEMNWKVSEVYEVANGTDQIASFTAQLQQQKNTSFASAFFTYVNDTYITYSLAYNSNDQLSKSSLIIDYQYGISDELYYNRAIRYAIEKGIMMFYTGGSLDLEGNSKTAPSVLTGSGLPPSTTIMAMFFPVFIIFALTFPFILYVYLIVDEKEKKIRSYLRAFGVVDTIYFSTWIIDGLLVSLFNTIVIMIFGYAAKIQFISNCASNVMFVVLMTYQLSLVAIAILLSSLLSRTRAAMIFAVIIFCIALAGSVFLSMVTTTLYGLWSDKAKYYNWLIAFQVISPLNFLKVLVDISAVTVGANFIDFGQQNNKPKGSFYSWSDFVGKIVSESAKRPITTTYNTITYIFIATLIYFLLAWYFDKVIPDVFGGRKAPWFLFTKQFWFPESFPEDVSDYDLQTTINYSDPDIQRESTSVNTENFDNYSLVVRNLVKRYGSKKVVDGLSFNAEKGKIIAMLGHNGAGKTTTINMITGQTTISGGNIFVHGYNVATQVDHVKTLLGLCPQFDVYWPDFTAREHLTIMTLVKEKRSNIREDITEILASVRLSSVADNAVSTYSGGMRRRLSVALGIIGDPQVIVLDEPTTGIDPANRRYIWKLIKSIKKDKLILLTTHSMEEADALGDKIVIMDEGRLRGAGTALHLKSRFGTGYKLYLVTTDIEQAQQLVRQHLPIATLDRINSMNLVYTIPSMEQLSAFLKYLTHDKSAETIITDWQIQNTTLEDVFLHMVKHKQS